MSLRPVAHWPRTGWILPAGAQGDQAMQHRLLVVRKDHRGCILLDGGKPLAWYPSIGPALELARTLADASALREGPPVRVELRSYGQPPRELPAYS